MKTSLVLSTKPKPKAEGSDSLQHSTAAFRPPPVPTNRARTSCVDAFQAPVPSSLFVFYEPSLLDMRTRNAAWRIAHCACALPGVTQVAKVARGEGSAAEAGRRGPRREGSRDEGRVDVER